MTQSQLISELAEYLGVSDATLTNGWYVTCQFVDAKLRRNVGFSQDKAECIAIAKRFLGRGALGDYFVLQVCDGELIAVWMPLGDESVA
jgi:hypothetical protein